jgi:hypothetical protein
MIALGVFVGGMIAGLSSSNAIFLTLMSVLVVGMKVLGFLFALRLYRRFFPQD